MEKKKRIKKNEEFQEVFKRGKSSANRQFVIYALEKSDQSHLRLGLSVSKRVGNAVTRNRIKRVVKEIFMKHEGEILSGRDYIIIARNPTADMDFSEMEKSLLHVLQRAGSIRQSKGRRK
ncbi:MULTISPECIES: ribonuclease P protein component [Fictibacillus]|uniref:Ribonuclease P protein component n=1 Tax=Fictibacillus terranigra TaxID=3058424 RepID=A0ABT8E0H3_9BACL|nr:ribonuclease P protein component [Fictibacillus sp. CENA-BCM004]MDN4071424.1 ribonuclease P protein component [Fictibacillus sp. CENA-BCM004]